MFNIEWTVKKVVATIRHDDLRKLTTNIVAEVSNVMEKEPILAPLFVKVSCEYCTVFKNRTTFFIDRTPLVTASVDQPQLSISMLDHGIIIG